MTAVLEPGDCRDVLLEMAARGELFDAVVTDPPYHLESIQKRFGKAGSAAAKSADYRRVSRGFHGQEWDGGAVSFDPATWEAVSAVMKPGAHLLAFGAPRTYHRLATAIEDAGFEVFDSILWLFGQGWPKRKGLLKPAHELICVGRKAGPIVPMDTDACRIPLPDDDSLHAGVHHSGKSLDASGAWGFKAVDRPAGLPRWPANLAHDGSDDALSVFPESKGQQARAVQNGPLDSGGNTYAPRKQHSNTPDPRGDSGSASRFFWCAKASHGDKVYRCPDCNTSILAHERAAHQHDHPDLKHHETHPTCKPLVLMRWLCRLVTPPGGRILDPFAGSGTTLQAAVECGFSAVGIEREAPYQADIRRRLAALDAMFD